jgi:hypothetical protein
VSPERKRRSDRPTGSAGGKPRLEVADAGARQTSASWDSQQIGEPLRPLYQRVRQECAIIAVAVVPDPLPS